MTKKKPNQKTCAVCKEVILPRSGIHYNGYLIHRKCKVLFKKTPWRYIR
jgi:hypothetical protein